MGRRFAGLACMALLCPLAPSTSHGQLSGLYEFDGGGDGTSWDDAANWERVLDPNGFPISGNPSAPPNAVTSAGIPLVGVTIDGSMPGQTALDVGIGLGSGAGSLGISGGDLTVRDLFVGNDANGANAGSLQVSAGTLAAADDITIGAGSAGTVNLIDGSVSTGDDLLINADSHLGVSGGTIAIGDRLVMEDDATLTLDGGAILVDDDFFLFGDSQVVVLDGLLEIADKLRFDDDIAKIGRLTINGGIVRSNEFGFEELGAAVFRGVVEINGNGVYQVEAPGPGSPLSQLSVADALLLIADGVHFTSSGTLGATTVIVPAYLGRTNVAFTQISIVPEPASLVLLGLGVLGLGARGRCHPVDGPRRNHG